MVHDLVQEIRVCHLAVFIGVRMQVVVLVEWLPGTDCTVGARSAGEGDESATAALDVGWDSGQVEALVLQEAGKLGRRFETGVVDREASDVKLVQGAAQLVRRHVVKLVAEHGQDFLAEVDQVHAHGLQVRQKSGPDHLLVVLGVPGGAKGLKEVDNLRPRVDTEAASSIRLLIDASLDRKVDGLSEAGVVVAVEQVGALPVVVELDYDAEVDVTDGLAERSIQLCEAAQVLGPGEGEGVLAPEKTGALGMHCLAGDQEVDGKLVAAVLLL